LINAYKSGHDYHIFIRIRNFMEFYSNDWRLIILSYIKYLKSRLASETFYVILEYLNI